jgi:diguanylate cyclase (GGDEF)-like protein
VLFLRLGVLVPALFAACGLSFSERPHRWLRNLLMAILLLVGLTQVAVHGILAAYPCQNVAPYAAFQLSIVFFYMLSAVGLRRSAFVGMLSSVCYLVMEQIVYGQINYVHFHSLVLANAAGLASGMVFERLLRDLFFAERRARAMSLEDALTALPNRRATLAHLDRCLRLAQRERRRLTLIMVDIDHFKHLNDYAGHAFGDRALMGVALCLGKVLRRPLDLVGRIGGEEFLLISMDGSETEALQLAEDCCRVVREAQIPHPGVPLGFVTISAGAFVSAAGLNALPEALMHAADQAMYEAKQTGRDRACLAAQTLPTDYPLTPPISP